MTNISQKTDGVDILHDTEINAILNKIQNGTDTDVRISGRYATLGTFESGWGVKKPATYVIYRDTSTYYAEDGRTGDVSFSGTDAQVVIQAAVNAIQTAPGFTTKSGLLYFKAGNYSLSSAILIDGSASTTIQNITITGDDKLISRFTPTVNLPAFRIKTITQGTTFRNVCFAISAGLDTSYTHSMIECEDNCEWVEVSNCYFNRGNAIRGQDGTGWLVSGNNFEATHTGIGMTAATGFSSALVRIVGNHWSNQKSGSVAINFTDNNSRQNLYVLIADNVFAGTAGATAISASMIRSIIHGNEINFWGTAIEEKGTADRNYIFGNHLHSNTVSVTKIGTNTQVRNNFGYATESGGDSSISHGTTVSHGLATTPSRIVLISQSASPRITSIKSKSASTFTVGLWNTAGSALTGSGTTRAFWYAEV